MVQKTQVLIIGGGVTGTGIARDLALRGIHGVLVERGHINAGASGANHGLLHSGARYITTDPESSIECREENEILKRIAPHCVEAKGGIYVSVPEDDENYLANFAGLCQKCGIPCRPLDTHEAREMEPVLSDRIIAAYQTEDASIDPFRISHENLAQALQLGYQYLPRTSPAAFHIRSGKIRSVLLVNQVTGEEQTIEVDQVVNAAGAWVGEVAALVGASIDILFSKGSLIVTNSRLAHRLLLRLRPPSDGDVLAPGGSVSIFGPSSVRLESLDDIRPTVTEVDHMLGEGIPIIPSLADTRLIRAYSGVRPLIAQKKVAGSNDDRAVSRGFDLIQHTENGLENFLTVAGGKLSIFRLMAEKASDLICNRLGVDTPCRTRTEPLPSTLDHQWTEPGASPKLWLANPGSVGSFLCECEMIPESVIDSIHDRLTPEDTGAVLYAIGNRSRMGKGSCQGTFCGLRVTAHLYDRGDFSGGQGIDELKQFINSRWKGQRPVLWGEQLKQAELLEAIYCGLFNMESPNQTEEPGT